MNGLIFLAIIILRYFYVFNNDQNKFPGLLYLMGMICFAAGWGSERMVMLCGNQAEPFVSADCTTGTKLKQKIINGK